MPDEQLAKVPRKVAELADRHGLGTLVAVHKGHTALGTVLFAAGMFAAGVGVAALGGILRFLFVLGLAIIIFSFVAVAFALKTAAAGVVGTFIYSNGFVLREKRRLQVVPWTQVAELRRVRAGTVMPAHPVPEQVTWHKAVLRDGTQLDVGSDKVAPRVEELAAAVRIPVSG
jgi:hypothetical protein